MPKAPESHNLKTKQKFKNRQHRFVDPGFLTLEKWKSCLRCSLIEINSWTDTVFWTQFGGLRNYSKVTNFRTVLDFVLSYFRKKY